MALMYRAKLTLNTDNFILCLVNWSCKWREFHMDDHQLPKDELGQYRTRASSGGGKGGTRRRTRVGSGGSDDEALFNEIMNAVRRIERRTGSVPTLSMLANETRISLTKIRQVLAKFLPNATTEGDTEFASSLRELLFVVENGLISPGEWAQVQLERERAGEPISLILARLGLASENQVKNALELQYGVNYVPLAKMEPPPPGCLDLLPESLVRKHKIIPILKDGKRVTIAMVNPNDLLALDEIKLLLKGMQIKISVCTEGDFQLFIDTIHTRYLEEKKSANYDKESQQIDDQSGEPITLVQSSREANAQRELATQPADAPIIMLANQIIAKGIKKKVSEIQIKPQEKEIEIFYCLGGELILDRKLPKPLLSALVTRFKVMFRLDIADCLLPQEGRLDLDSRGNRICFSISICPTAYGEHVILCVAE